MPLVERIFLESRPAFLPQEVGGHMYLVKRLVEVDSSGVVISNNVNRASDRVINGDSSGLNLVTSTVLLQNSIDFYPANETPFGRHSIDITSLVGGIGKWSLLETAANAIKNKYYYELPFPLDTHIGNSNAVILTVLESIGVDIRNIMFDGAPYVDSFYVAGAPGANIGNATLLAIGDVTSADGLTSDVHLLGRHGLSDTFINTSLNEKFYGEQSRPELSSGTDTVRYNAVSGQGVTLDASIVERTGADGLKLSSASTGQDILYYIERIELSDRADHLRINFGKGELGAITAPTIDAGSQSFGTYDILDFSGRSAGIELKSGGSKTVQEAGDGLLTPSIKFKNFEEIRLTNGNDVVKGVTQALIHTGDGNDVISIAYTGLLLIDDANYLDRLKLGDYVLTGGVKYKNSENIFAKGQNDLRFARLSDDTLLIKTSAGGETYVKDFNWAVGTGVQHTAGIYVLEYYIDTENWASVMNGRLSLPANYWTQDTACQIEKALYGGLRPGTDPLILDLDGNGIELGPDRSSSASFDFNRDQFAQKAGWTTGNDGFLVRDINGNGKIDDIGEMFGDATTSGFVHLTALDGNSDGKVSALDNGLADFNGDGQIDIDDTFATLKVWVDTDRDGVTDAGELQSLSSLDIVSIATGSTVAGTTVGGNTIAATGTFERADGTTGTIADVRLTTNNYDSRWLGSTTVSAAAAAQINIKGHGTLTDLHVAMTLDPDLIDAVQSTLSTLTSTSLADLREAVRPALHAWMAAVPVPADSPGTENPPDFHFVASKTNEGLVVYDSVVQFTDEQGTYYGYASLQPVYGSGLEGPVIKPRPTFAEVLASTPAQGEWFTFDGADVAFLERWMGRSLPFATDIDTGPEAIDGLKQLILSGYNELNLVAVRFASQGALAPFFDGVSYNATSEQFTPTTEHQLVPMLEAIFAAAPSTAPQASDYIGQWLDIFKIVMQNFQRDDYGREVTNPYLFQQLVGAYENSSLPLTLQQAAKIFAISPDIIKSGTGDVSGTANTDLFYLGTGVQHATGGAGHDVYVVGKDFGQDTIQDVYQTFGDEQEDSIRFAHLNPEDLEFSRVGADLIIKQIGTTNELRVFDEFIGRRPGFFFGYIDPDKSIELITFANGEVWDKLDIARAAGKNFTATNGVLAGSSDVDFLYSGAEDELLSGGDEGDHYVFAAGSGHDTIRDQQSYIFLDNYDSLNFGPGIERENVTFRLIGNDLEASINETDDVVRIAGQYRVYYNLFNSQVDRIEIFSFADGSYYSYEDILHQILASAGTDGDDIIFGVDYEDILDGKGGNDFLSGGNENDTYVFGKGYGHDSIQDRITMVLSGEVDTVYFKEDVSRSDVSLARGAGASFNDLLIALSSGDTLTVINQFGKAAIGGWYDRIEKFYFSSSGETITDDDVMNILLSQSITNGDDTVYGFTREETIIAGAGDDYLDGGDLGDTYVWARGDGNDRIFEDPYKEGIDKVVLVGINPSDVSLVRLGSQMKLVIPPAVAGGTDGGSITFLDGFNNYYNQGVEQIVFANGTIWSRDDVRAIILAQQSTAGDDTVIGFEADDTITGGTGNDRLEGRSGSDTYVYTRGDGHDIISDPGNNGEADKLVLHGVNFADIIVHRNATGAKILIAPSAPGGTDGGSIQLLQGVDFDSYSQGIEYFYLDDGTVLTRAQFRAMASTPFIPTEGIDVLNGTSGDDEIYALGGDDTASGLSGDDVIDGGFGNDILIGGAGNDTLRGGHHGDTYVYSLGDGNDVIQEDGSNGETDKLVFTDLNPADLKFSRTVSDTKDLVVTVIATGSTILIDEHFARESTGLEQIQFADGTIWNRDQIEVAAVYEGTANDDVIAASHSANLIKGYGGNDVIDGDFGDDTIVGGLGNDVLRGGNNNDTYLYAFGDGNDVIAEQGDSSEIDRLVFTDLISPQVSFTRTASDFNDLLIKIVATGETITVDDHFYSNSRGLEELRFANGVTLDRSQIEAATVYEGTSAGDVINASSASNIILAGAGDDIVDGNDGDDKITGGTGSDILRGDGGSDSFYFASGDGNDTIAEQGADSDNDRLILTNLNVANVAFVRSIADPSDLLIKIAATNEVITVDRHFDSSARGIEQIEFADGTVLDRAQIRSAVVFEGTSSADQIYGDGAADTIRAGLGNDYVRGNGGSDVYLYSSGDGADTIDDESGSTTDVDILRLTNLNETDVSLSRLGDHAFLTVNGTGETIKISYQFYSAYENWGVERIEFANGNFWDQAQIVQKTATAGIVGTTGADIIDGTSSNDTIRGLGGDDTIRGFDGNDQLEGNQGNDNLRGDAGSDVYIYRLGDGSDTIDDESGSTTNIDILRLNDINEVDVSISRLGQHAFLTVNGTGETIKLAYQFYSASENWGVERIEFANGNFWDLAQIFQRAAIVGTAGSDILDGSAAHDTIRGLAGDDTIRGFDGNDRLEGNQGNDSLRGDAGSDVYTYRLGDGSDIIDDESGSTTDIDILRLTDLNEIDVSLSRLGQHAFLTVNGTGETIKLAYQFYSASENWGVERIEFANGSFWDLAQISQRAAVVGTVGADILDGSNGNDTIRGLSGDDTIYGQDGLDQLEGNQGNDRLEGGSGADTYRYASGDGNDLIIDYGAATETDKLVLTDLNLTDVAFKRSGDNLLVSIVQTNETITVRDHFYGNNLFGLKQLQFADGTTLDRAQIRNLAVIEGTSGDDFIFTGDSADNVNGLGGNDYIGTGGGDDILVGGAGNDNLYGGSGSDAFVFKASFGKDTINDFSLTASVGDHIQFDMAVFANFTDIQSHMAQVGDDTIITYDVDNSVTLKNVTASNLNSDHFWFV